MTTSLVSILKGHAETRSDAPAITHLTTDRGASRTISYREIAATAEKLAAILTSYNVGKRDRVAFVVRNHWLVFPLLAACTARRATLVPIDPDLHRDELSFILTDAAPALTIHLDGAAMPNVNGKGKLLTLSGLVAALESNESPPPLDASVSTDVALMIYTSGTTGTNKCVMLTDGNLVANATALGGRYGIRSDDRFFCTLPTHHMNAMMMTGMVPLLAGAHIFLSDILSFKNAKHYWRNLSEHEITVCSLVPSIMALLLKLFPKGASASIKKLRFGFCGAAPLPAHTWKEFEEVFGLPIYQGYGLTETTCWAVSSPPDVPRQWLSVGVPLEGCEVKIDHSQVAEIETYLFDQNSLRAPVDRESAPAEPERFVSGEVLIKGAIVGPGYYKNAKLTKESVTPDGFFRTGDLGFFDSEGYLHISGRLKEIIIKNGANVFSKDVDRVLCEHEAVETSKTIGVRDELVGERIFSACVLKEGKTATDQELRAFAQSRLSHHMWPDAIALLGYLPAGAAGKVSTNVLRKIVSGELTEEILTSLGSWKFKRAQASGIDAIRATVQDALMRGAPISFLSYWGCGKRDAISGVDRMSLDRLRDYVSGARRVPQAPPRVTILFTDMHARNNGIPEDRMNRYWDEVRAYASNLGMDCQRLSDIWNAAGLTPAQIAEEARSKAFEEEWGALAVRAQLIDQAAKHFEGAGDPEEAAKRYYLSCKHEGIAIAARYPSSIFATYNHPDFDCVSPPLPKQYLYSSKEGTSVKPWFVDG